MSRSFSLLVLPLTFAAAACGGDNTDDPGADAATAADGNTGGADAGTADTANNNQPPSCDPSFGAAPGCGGSPIGSWTYRGACGASAIEDDVRAACNTAVFRATSHVVTGTLDFTAGTYTVDVTNRADVEMTIPAACAAQLGGCAGVASALSNSSPTQCTQEGTDCSCTSMVTVSTAQTGTYTAQGGVVTTTPTSGNGASYNFCVESGVFRYREQGDAVVYVLTPR